MVVGSIIAFAASRGSCPALPPRRYAVTLADVVMGPEGGSIVAVSRRWATMRRLVTAAQPHHSDASASV